MAASSVMLSVLIVAVVVCGGGGGSVAAGANTALDGVCGILGEFYVTRELCTSTLCHDASSPCGAARDAHEVAVLAARLAAANATKARDSIQAALSSPSAAASNSSTGEEGEASKAGLRSCLQLYTGIVAALEWAAGTVAAGRYPGAREVMQAAQDVTGGCRGMAGAALPKENSGFAMMAIVAHAVIGSMS